MKKLIIAAILALTISTSAHAEECIATDKCILFTSMDDLMGTFQLYQRGADAFQFVINELVAAGKIINPAKGMRINVVAKSGELYQVFYNGRIHYTISLSVNCR